MGLVLVEFDRVKVHRAVGLVSAVKGEGQKKKKGRKEGEEEKERALLLTSIHFLFSIINNNIILITQKKNSNSRKSTVDNFLDVCDNLRDIFGHARQNVRGQNLSKTKKENAKK